MYSSRNIWELDCHQCESLISEYKCTLSDDFCQDNQPHKWVHAGCGGHLRLYENGKEKCQKCGYENYFCNWNYESAPKNQRNDPAKIRAVLQYLVGMDDSKVSYDYWFNLKASLNYQMKTFPNKFL